MRAEKPTPRTKVQPLDRETVDQLLRDHSALRRDDHDCEIEAVRAAILIEDVFAVTLPDADIDPAVLTDPSAVFGLVSRLRCAD